jgi:hypothetical protein
MNQDEIKSFFSNVHLVGTNYERAKTIATYLRSRADGQTSNFVCIVGTSFAARCYVDGNKWLEFENNSKDISIGKLTSLAEIEDFKQKAIIAVDLAEQEIAGSLEDKRDRFKDAFNDKVNIIVYKDTSATYFTYSFGCSFSERRGDTTYEAWLVE